MRAARALLGLDQRQLAQAAGLSLPTIQRMESSDGVVRGNVDSMMKLVDALTASGIELIGEGAASERRRPRSAAQMMVRPTHCSAWRRSAGAWRPHRGRAQRVAARRAALPWSTAPA